MNSSAAALFALRAFQRSASLSSTSSNNAWVASRTMASSKGSTTKVGGASSSSSGAVNLAGKTLDPPPNVFKEVDKSALGPGASKQSDYKNPEYFSYHNMSYTEMELVMAKFRVPQPSNKRTSK